jgi:hypothetical protein
MNQPTIRVLFWRPELPTEPGWYWIWQPGHCWPCHGQVCCVRVALDRGVLVADVPGMDYADPVADRDTWEDTVWMGPIEPPTPPWPPENAP